MTGSSTDPWGSWPWARVRRLPDAGRWCRRKVTEIEYRQAGGSSTTRVTTSQPYGILKPLLGWDEAALVVSRSDKAWTGGVGPWVEAFTGTISPEHPDAHPSQPVERPRTRASRLGDAGWCVGMLALALAPLLGDTPGREVLLVGALGLGALIVPATGSQEEQKETA